MHGKQSSMYYWVMGAFKNSCGINMLNGLTDIEFDYAIILAML